MQQTYQDRLTLDATQSRWLNAFGEMYGRLQRTLYAHAAKGEKLNDLKSSFCAQHGLSARQFNAMRMELEGKISSTVELLKLRKKELAHNIKGVIRSIVKLEKQIAGQNKLRLKAQEKGIEFSLKQRNTWLVQCFGKKRRLVVLQVKANDIDQRLQANTPGICFGSRKLFNQQFHLELTEFGAGEAGHAAWRRAWLDSRSHQFFLVGSKDETTGNQSCKARIVHAPPTTEIAGPCTLTLTVKMPQALVDKGAPAFLNIEGVHFNYGHGNVLKALQNGTALSYRFHRDNHTTSGWRVFVATDTLEAKITSLDKNLGVIGVDFNADHLAWAHVDRFGNASNKTACFGRIDLPLKGKTTEQRTAILSDALDKVLAIAKGHCCPIAIEDLDFTAKKRELTKLGVKGARMLSGLAYARYKSLVLAKAARSGIEIIIVDPAYTSVAGSVKCAVRLGRTVHQAAAGVIARRAQGLKEKLPKKDLEGNTTFKAPLMGRMAVITLPARNRADITRVTWVCIRKGLTQHCAELVRVRKDASSRFAKRRKPDSASVVNSHQLQGDTSSCREPVTLLDRRNPSNDLPDVPF
jgi:IS605 OrfB family transposase